MSQSVQSKSNPNTSRLSERAAIVADDLREVGAAAKRTAVDGAEAVRDTAQEVYEKGRAKANEVLDEGRARAREMGHGVQLMVQEQPVKSLLVAAGVGFLLGALWMRR
jgi:ElaB/YqjD/DUF883 family membrane-anchored ribosome-binding protein